MSEIKDDFKGKRSLIGKNNYYMPNQIVEAVADRYMVSVDDMKSIKRIRKVCFPRHVAMFLMLRHTRMSLGQIGEFFGGRDHTTVGHARDVVAGLMKSYSDVTDEINFIIKKASDMNVYVEDVDSPKAELAEAVYILRFLRSSTKSWDNRPGFTTMQEMKEWELKADEFLKKISSPK